MSDLVAFLTARLDETEEVARTAFAPLNCGEGRWHVVDMSLRDDGDHLVVKHSWPRELEHIARHDPARVLRDVEAKRRIVLDACEPLLGDYPTSGAALAWTVLRALASTYADHPDYDQEWGKP